MKIEVEERNLIYLLRAAVSANWLLNLNKGDKK